MTRSRPAARPRVDLLLVLGAAAGLAAVAVARLALLGWDALAPDDARYLYVGLSTLDGRGPVTPDGTLFLLRSPVYGIALAAGGWITGDGRVAWARIVESFLAIGALVGAVALARSLAGTAAAVGTALALLSMTLLWQLLPTLRIDLPQTAGVVATLLAIQRPTVRRWALAGALLGLTILVKETIGLLAAAPLAFIGTVPLPRLGRLAVVYLGVAAIVAGWWWIVVWSASGAIFPLNAIGVIERRDVAAGLRIDRFAVLIVAVVAGAWLVVAGLARRERRLRLLVVAGACLGPATAYATLNGLDTRNLAGLAVLSAIAVGVAAARAVTVAGDRVARGGRIRATLPAIVAVAGVLIAAVGQARAGDPVRDPLPSELAAALRADAAAGSHVVMSFRDRELVALELYGRVGVASLPTIRVTAGAALDDWLWIGLRDRQLFGIARADWAATLSQPGTSRLVLAGPHPLTPAELLPALDDDGAPGLALERRLDAGTDWAAIYAVTPAAVPAGAAGLPLHLAPAAAVAWLDLAGTSGAASAAGRLVALGPIVVGSDAARLIARLAGVGCLVAEPAEGPAAYRVIPIAAGCHGQ